MTQVILLGQESRVTFLDQSVNKEIQNQTNTTLSKHLQDATSIATRLCKNSPRFVSVKAKTDKKLTFHFNQRSKTLKCLRNTK